MVTPSAGRVGPLSVSSIVLSAVTDRDGDGRLTLNEWERFLRLLVQRAACQLSMIVQERGRNLFDTLDADGDGRLYLRELNGAARAFAPNTTFPLDRD